MPIDDSSPSCFSLSGVRRSNGSSHPQFSNFREDKENIPHEDDEEDGPILYRDDDSMEEEGKFVCVQNIFNSGRMIRSRNT